MKLVRLYLSAFGPFTDRVIELGSAGQPVVLIHGPNEAGKSATRRAIGDLRFGIGHSSTDAFRHPYAAMRVGGVFLDPQGQEIGLMRRKGKGQTLLRRDPRHMDQESTEPLNPLIEGWLTGGLSRDEYDTLFGLDHAGLRQGGQALLEGEGEVGAALFEASAGVHSVKALLSRLDQSARQLYMPGSHARNARINEAVRTFEQGQDDFRKAVLRPQHWIDLDRRHEDAARMLNEQLMQQRELGRQLTAIRELRAVAPMLRARDQSAAVLATLAEAVVLPEDAPAALAAAQSGLEQARSNAQRASAALEREQARLAAIPADDTVLGQAAAIDRLAGAAGQVDALRDELAQAGVQADHHREALLRLAARIEPALTPEALVALAPAPAARARLEDALREAEQAAQDIAASDAALARLDEETLAPAEPPLPGPAVRTALRSARIEATRQEASLRRLADLPAEIETAQRTLTGALRAVGVAQRDAFEPMNPLLDAEIDLALSQREQLSTQGADLQRRIAEIDAALGQETGRHQDLLVQGAVPTAQDVAQARAHRDSLWQAIRAGLEGAGAPDAASAPEYERAVRAADRLADDLARDTQRAALLQAAQREIDKLTGDRNGLTARLLAQTRQTDDLQQRWSERLAQAGLPCLAPELLREWQGRLMKARAAAETLDALQAQAGQAGATAAALSVLLAGAIADTGLPGLPCAASPDALAARADEIERELTARETRLATASGEQQQRARERARLLTRQAGLREALAASREALDSELGALRLPAGSGTAVARARLAELQALADRHGELAESLRREAVSRQSLQTLGEQIHAIELALVTGEGLPAAAGLRLSIDRLAGRLARARQDQGERLLAQQAVAQAGQALDEHEAAARAEADRLAAMCAQAGVDAVAELADAHARSARRRAAQAEVERSDAQLAQAAQHPIDDLRAQLEGREAHALDAEEIRITDALAPLESRIQATRAELEQARRALDAIDSADAAAAARESMEQARAGVAAAMGPWMRTRLAHALLTEATRRFRERAQGPMLGSASASFERMTGGAFTRLGSDDSSDRPVLVAQRRDGSRIGTEAMSEGTRDQLYLALRLAALTLRRQAGLCLPLVLDDVLMTSDDTRAALMLQALAEFAGDGQVLIFTHHRHLVEVARRTLSSAVLATVEL
jgi:uncharacterized protein YhaN